MLNKPTIIQYLGPAGLVSCLGGILGILALVNVINDQPLWAILFVILAFGADCVDGLVARKTNSASDFGRQLDGMFDFLNYSIFSGAFIYKFFLPNALGIMIATMIILFGAIRLVRFNLEGFFKKDGVWCYPGLGTTLVLVPLIIGFLIGQLWEPAIIFGLIGSVVIGVLQISRIPLKKNANLYLWAIPLAVLCLAYTIYRIVVS